MALAFGGGVRPELGRTDYSAIARGGEIAAQLSAQGSQMVGQGLAKALEGAGKAVVNYQERKQEKQFKEESIKNIAKFATENPDVVKGLGFNSDIIDDSKAIGVFVQGLSPKGNFIEGMAVLSTLMAQSMQQKQIAGMKAEENAARLRLLDEQTRKESLQADELKTKQNDQGALSKALTANTSTPGVPIDYNEVRRDFLDFGGQNLELVNALEQSNLKTGFTPSTMPFKLSDGSSIDVVMVSPNSAQVILPPNSNKNTPAAIQEIQYKAELSKQIPQLLRDGKDDDAIAIATALEFKNPFGAIDAVYLRSQFGIEKKEETQDDVAQARAIIGKNK
jgi:hypothetical protein